MTRGSARQAAAVIAERIPAVPAELSDRLQIYLFS
jgi:hypothetical protein